LPSIDYWIGDAIATPLSSDEKFVEKVLRLPCWCVFRRPASAPDIAALPALTSGHLTFGCFNNPAKLSRSTVTAWAAIMRSARGSRLLLRYLHSYEEHRLRDRLVDDFERLGVAGDRIEFETSVATRTGHLGYYNRVDVALDPFPFSGCNATFEALWMGVPVVSLAGRRFLARMGASFLPHAGLPGLVAATIDEYVDVAVHLATDISALSELRQGLRGRVARSRLCDAEGYSSALFGALAEAHR
jgi:predicted O-linked N-acetylglucosamine transferase (SPINDLY family)